MIIVYGMQHKSMVTATTDKLRRKWKLRKGWEWNKMLTKNEMKEERKTSFNNTMNIDI